MSQGSQSSVSFRRSERTAAYDSVMVRPADTGSILGQAATDVFVSNVREFAQAVHQGSVFAAVCGVEYPHPSSSTMNAVV
jgi:hypothetical protein